MTFRPKVLPFSHPWKKKLTHLLITQDNPELLSPVDYSEIRSLTTRMHQQISSGTLDSPSWNLVRTAKLAARIYAPLGTRMTLGDYVRVSKRFLEAFKAPENRPEGDGSREETGSELVQLRQDLKVGSPSPAVPPNLNNGVI
jgi:glycerol-3-phosphate O-acyltransferase/dihydroxyacetone phosphate acyltransferase